MKPNKTNFKWKQLDCSLNTYLSIYSNSNDYSPFNALPVPIVLFEESSLIVQFENLVLCTSKSMLANCRSEPSRLQQLVKTNYWEK